MTNKDTPRGIVHLTYTSLSRLTRHVPLGTLTAWQGMPEACRLRAALDQAVLRDDLDATKHAGRALIRWYRDQVRAMAATDGAEVS